jgi:pimeloyl-ACP methyl ester carboxylesterase
VTIYYTESGVEHLGGPGPHYLLMHGLGGSRQQWIPVQRELGVHCYSIAVDIPGFGQSRGEGRFDIHRAAEQIAQFCQTRRLDDYVLVAHSIGGTVAGLVAAHPDVRFRRVILVSGSLFRASAIAQRPLSGMRDPSLTLYVAAQFLAGSVPVLAVTRRLLAASSLIRAATLWPFVANPRGLDPLTLEATLVGCGSPAVLRILLKSKTIDYVKIMSTIPQPVDLIWGARDRLISAADVRTASRLLKVQRTHVIADCGHWPLIEQTHELVSLLKMWGEHEPARAES